MCSRSSDVTGNSTLKGIFCSILIGVLVVVVNTMLNPGAFYIDDMQAQYAPTLMSIAETMRNAGEVPFLTLHNWYGGNLISEYQYALYNPIALFLIYWMPVFGGLASGAAFLGASYTAIMSGGVYFLARKMGVSNAFSYIAVFAMATNNYVFYWFSSTWLPGLVSLAFMVWAMAFCLIAHRGRMQFSACAISVWLVATAGYPYAVAVLCLFFIVHALVKAFHEDWQAFLPSMLACALGVAAAAPALFPLFGIGAFSARPEGVYNNGFLVPSLNDVISFVNPAYHGKMYAWGGYNTILMPMFYMGWFVLPMLVLFSARLLRDRNSILLVFLAAITVVLSLGPEQVGPMRFSFRMVPYFHLFTILLALLAFSGIATSSAPRRRFVLYVGLMFLSLIMSLQSDPHNWKWPLLWWAVLSVYGYLVFFRFSLSNRQISVLTITMVLVIFVVTRVETPKNTNLADWGFFKKPEIGVNLTSVPKAYAVHLTGGGNYWDKARFDEMIFGQMGLVLNEPTVNGYSPIGHQVLAGQFCVKVNGLLCPEIVGKLLQRDPGTGATYADLMRVDSIIVERGDYLNLIQKLDMGHFNVVTERQRSVVYRQELANRRLPGSVSWPLAGITIASLERGSAEREKLQVSERGSGVSRIIFARTWWPGYQATFRGRTVPVEAYSGFLVSVVLPDDQSGGELVLTYTPAGQVAGRTVFFAAISMALGILLFWRKVSSLLAAIGPATLGRLFRLNLLGRAIP